MDRLLWRRRVSPGTIARWVEAARGGVPGLVTSSPEANPPSGFAAKNALGLSSADARARLARDGPNVLPSPAPPSAWRDLAAQMVHFFALMLWFAGALAFLAGMLTVASPCILPLLPIIFGASIRFHPLSPRGPLQSSGKSPLGSCAC